MKRGKEYCRCIKRQNPHLLPRGIINLRKTKKILLHDSITKFAKLQDPCRVKNLKENIQNYQHQNRQHTMYLKIKQKPTLKTVSKKVMNEHQYSKCKS